jgi:hypothetical protein
VIDVEKEWTKDDPMETGKSFEEEFLRAREPLSTSVQPAEGFADTILQTYERCLGAVGRVQEVVSIQISVSRPRNELDCHHGRPLDFGTQLSRTLKE